MRGMRILGKYLGFLLCLNLFCCVLSVSSLAEEQEGKEIHIVWDTSASMIRTQSNKESTKRWAEADYALKAFSAIIGEQDQLKLFPMEEIDSPVSGMKPREIVTGDRQKRVDDLTKNLYRQKISTYTYYGTVDAAAQSDWAVGTQRWLVVITDGDFTAYAKKGSKKYPRTDEQLKDKLNQLLENDPTLHIIYLRLGSLGNSKPSGLNSRLYWLSQGKDDKIADLLLDVSKIIFNRADIPENQIHKSAEEISINLKIPIRELIVFVQSADGSFKDTGHEIQKRAPAAVNGTGASFAAPQEDNEEEWPDIEGYPGKEKIEKVKFADDSGSMRVYTAEGDTGIMPEGEYVFENNTQYTYSFFYTPAVDISVEMTQDGSVIEGDELEAGPCKLKVILRNSLTKEVLEDTRDYFKKEDFKITVEYAGAASETICAEETTLDLVPGTVTLTAGTTHGESDPIVKTVLEPPIPVSIEAELLQNHYFEESGRENPSARLSLSAQENINNIPLTDLTWTASSESLAWNVEASVDGNGWILYPVLEKEQMRQYSNSTYHVKLTLSTSRRIRSEAAEVEIRLEHKPQILTVSADSAESVSAWSLYRGREMQIRLNYLYGEGEDAVSLDTGEIEKLTAQVGAESLKTASIQEDPFELLIQPGKQWMDFKGESESIYINASYDCGGTLSSTEEGAYVVIRVKPMTARQKWLEKWLPVMIKGLEILCNVLLALFLLWLAAWYISVCHLQISVPLNVRLYRNRDRAILNCKEKNKFLRCLFLQNKVKFDMGAEDSPLLKTIILARKRGGGYEIQNYEEFDSEEYELNGEPITGYIRMVDTGSVLTVLEDGMKKWDFTVEERGWGGN